MIEKRMIEERTIQPQDYSRVKALSEVPAGLCEESEKPAEQLLRPFLDRDADDFEIEAWLSDAAEDEKTKSHVKLAIKTLQNRKGLSEKQQKLLDKLVQSIQKMEEVDLLNGDLTLFEKDYCPALFRIIKRSKITKVFAKILN